MSRLIAIKVVTFEKHLLGNQEEQRMQMWPGTTLRAGTASTLARLQVLISLDFENADRYVLVVGRFRLPLYRNQTSSQRHRLPWRYGGGFRLSVPLSTALKPLKRVFAAI